MTTQEITRKLEDELVGKGVVDAITRKVVTEAREHLATCNSSIRSYLLDRIEMLESRIEMASL